MPLDAAPADDGTVLLALVGGEWCAAVLGGDELRQERVLRTPLHVSHFATCPNASTHRRSRSPDARCSP